MAEETTTRLSDLIHEAGLIDRLGETIPGLVYVYDLIEQRNVFTNRSLADLLGHAPERVREMGDRFLASVIHPDDLARVLSHHAGMNNLAEGQVVEIEYRMRTASGDWLWLHSWESALTRDAAGRTKRFLGIAHDVTARVRAEAELREGEGRIAASEQRWRSIAENPFDFVVVIDRAYKYTFVNFVAPGVEREALLGKATPFDFVSKTDHPVMQAAFDTVFNEGRATEYDVYVPTLDKWYASLVGPIRDGNVVTHASVLTRDITTEKKARVQAQLAEDQIRSMELKLAQSAKLEAVGQLAGGIAHDFNNLLTGISASVDLLSIHLGPRVDVKGELADLRNAIARGAGLTRQLLAFSRQQPIALSAIDLNGLLDDTARMLRRLIGEDIEIDFPPVGASLFILADRTQMEQVFLNLALNARDAMPNGGRLKVTLGAAEIEEAECRWQPDARPGSYVRLSVQDSGSGMDAATVTRIFEPFFTTKPTGAGTGLGLSVVHGIVQQSGGFIQVGSKLGEGSTFDIYLPRTEPAAAPSVVEPAPLRGGNETVLLVEDDPMALRLTRQLLELLGYRVECAERGDEALGKIEGGLAFDLLLTDILLPGIDGLALHQRAEEIRAGCATVFMSGYTADVFAKRGIDGVGTVFLPKPFSHDELAEKVRAALDARTRA